MFKRILIGFDGSKGAEAALMQAIKLATVFDAELNIMTVFRHHSLLEASFSMVRSEDPETMDAVMRDYATGVADYAKSLAKEAGLSHIRAFVKPGHPSRSLVAFSKDHEVDLIVLGRRGLGSVEGYLLGSVSHKVTGVSDCAVLIV